jgi:hypothetical protein
LYANSRRNENKNSDVLTIMIVIVSCISHLLLLFVLCLAIVLGVLREAPFARGENAFFRISANAAVDSALTALQRTGV